MSFLVFGSVELVFFSEELIFSSLQKPKTKAWSLVLGKKNEIFLKNNVCLQYLGPLLEQNM